MTLITLLELESYEFTKKVEEMSTSSLKVDMREHDKRKEHGGIKHACLGNWS